MYDAGIDPATGDRERRRYPRLDKRAIIDAIEVTYPINDDQYSHGKTDNISQGGLMMRIADHFEEGSLLQMKIQLDGWHKSHPGFIRLLDKSDKTPFDVTAEVLRSEKDGDHYKIATQFINIDPEDFAAFQNYLDHKLSDKIAYQM